MFLRWSAAPVSQDDDCSCIAVKEADRRADVGCNAPSLFTILHLCSAHLCCRECQASNPQVFGHLLTSDNYDDDDNKA